MDQVALHKAVEFLVRCAVAAPSADNSQPWGFRDSADGLRVVYDQARVAGTTFAADEPATLLSVGAVLENLRAGAAAAGIALDVERWPDDAASYARVTVREIPANGLAAEASQAALFHRHTNRHPYRSTPIPAPVMQRSGGLFENRARVVWLPRKRHADMADLVRRASRIRFQTREVHEWLAKSLRFTPAEAAAGDGLDLATLALPPGGAALLASIDAQPIRSAPGLVGIVAPSAVDDVIDAGSLMQRLWIQLNREGLAVHPYYVVPDQLDRLARGRVSARFRAGLEQLSEECAQLFGLGQDERLQMLLRVGFPKKVAVLSRRLEPSRLTGG